MSDKYEVYIFCPQCNFSNAATAPDSGYVEAVYQPCQNSERNHNVRAQIRCTGCHKNFYFYWCTGHAN